MMRLEIFNERLIDFLRTNIHRDTKCNRRSKIWIKIFHTFDKIKSVPTSLDLRHKVKRKFEFSSAFISNVILHMTQLLSHTMAQFTGSSFMLKANNQPYKKFRVCIQLSKRCQKLQNFDFQCQFFMSKIIRIFPIFFHWTISI